LRDSGRRSTDAGSYLLEAAGSHPATVGSIQDAVPLVLPVLHRIAVSAPSRISDALTSCYWMFGPAAYFHLAGLLHASMSHHDDRWMLAETCGNLAPDVSEQFRPMVEEWLRQVDRPEGPGRRPFEEVRVLLDELEVTRREPIRLKLRIARVVEAREARHAEAIIERFKNVTEGIQMSGDDSPFPDAWEEYKDQVQGEQSIYFDLFELQIRELAHAYAEDLPPDELELLWMGTQAFQDAEPEEREAYFPDAIVEQLYAAVTRIAASEEGHFVSDADAGDHDAEEDDELAWTPDRGTRRTTNMTSREEARSIAEAYLNVPGALRAAQQSAGCTRPRRSTSPGRRSGTSTSRSAGSPMCNARGPPGSSYVAATSSWCP